MRRFFYNSYQQKRLDEYALDDVICLTEDIHHHWCRVLRAKVDEQALLFDGFGGEYFVELVEISKKSSKVRLLSHNPVDRVANFYSEIGLVMSRGDRMDYAIQKATEMGVTAIQLLTSHHGEVRLKPAQIAKKLTHWQQVAISACEQCGMNRIPLIFAPLVIENWLQQVKPEQAQVCEFIQPLLTDSFYQSVLKDGKSADLSLVLTVPKNEIPFNAKQLQDVLIKNNPPNQPLIRLLIGAEGGLTDIEIAEAQQVGFQSWQIGNRVLRTETAPVVALAILNAWIATSEF